MPLTIASEVLAPSAISLAKRVADVIFHGQLTEMSRPFQQWLSARESEIEFRRALSLALDALRRSDYAIEGRGAIDESLLCHEEFAKLLWSPLLDPESDHEVDITRLAKTYDEVVWGGIADSSSEELRARQREGLGFLVDVLYDEILWVFPAFAERLSNRVLKELDTYISPQKRDYVIRRYLDCEARRVRTMQQELMGGAEYVEPVLRRLDEEPRREEDVQPDAQEPGEQEDSGADEQESNTLDDTALLDIDSCMVSGPDLRVIVEAGSVYGKTTLLMEVLIRASRSWLPGRPVPFLFTPNQAGACTEANLQEILARRLASSEMEDGVALLHVRESQRRRIINALGDRGELLLLFDALDQIDHPQGLLGYLESTTVGQNRIVVSTRADAFAHHTGSFRTYARVQVAAFDRARVDVYFGPIAGLPSLRCIPEELLSIPILAFHIRTLLQADIGALRDIRNRSDLYKAFIHRLPTRDQDRQILGWRDPNDAIGDVRTLAFEMLKRNCLNSGFDRREAQRVLGEHRLADLERLQFVVRVLETGDKLFFRHRSIQEYLAGEALEEIWTQGNDIRLVSRYFLHPNWEEPLRFLAGSLTEPTRIEQLVKCLLAVSDDSPIALCGENLRLACLCLREAKADTPGTASITLKRIACLATRDVMRAIELLAVWGSGVALQCLVVSLRDEDKDLAREAAEALGKTGSVEPNVVSALIEALRNEDETVAWKAAAALGELGSAGPNVVSALIEALRDRNKDLAKRAAVALERIGSAEPNVVQALVHTLKDKDRDLATQAAIALGEIGSAGPDVVPALVEALGAKNWDTARAAALALGRIGSSGPGVVSALLEALSNKRSGLTWQAAVALGKIGSAEPDVALALVEALKGEDKPLAKRAADALGMIGSAEPNVVSPLVEALGDERKSLARAAAAALGRIGLAETDVVLALVSAMRGSNTLLARAGASALGKIGATRSAAVPTLIEALKANDEDLAWEAAVALGEIRSAGPNVVATLIEAHKNKISGLSWEAVAAPEKIRAADPAVVAALGAAIKSADRRLARHAADALGRIGSADPTGVSALVDALEDWHVAREVAIALGEIGADEPRVTSALVRTLRGVSKKLAREAAVALGNIGAGEPEVVSALIKTLRDRDKSLAREAAVALGKVGTSDVKAISALIRALGDTDEGVAREAAAALEKLGEAEPNIVTALIEAIKSEDKTPARADSGARPDSIFPTPFLGGRNRAVVRNLLARILREILRSTRSRDAVM